MFVFVNHHNDSNLNHESSYVALQCSFNPSFNFLKNRCELIPLDRCCDAMGSLFIDLRLRSLRPKVWMSAWKHVPICLNLLTVLFTDAVISTGRDSWVPGGLEGITSIRTTCKRQFQMCIEICLLPEVLPVSCTWGAAEGSGDTRVVEAESNHYKSVL